MRRFLALVVASCAFVFAPRANAQLHMDAEAGVGVMHRWFSNAPSDSGGHQPSFGPAGELSAHLALLPLVRVGAYFGADISPWSARYADRPHVDRNATRTAEYGGLQALVYIPIFPRSMKGWLDLGIGGGDITTRSVHVNGLVTTLLPGHGHGFAEAPLGLGASYTFWKPWSVYAELKGRVIFANSEEDGFRDQWALGLTAGIQVEL